MAQPPLKIEATATMAKEHKRTILYEGPEADLILQKLALLHTPGVLPGEWPDEVQLAITLIWHPKDQ